MSGGVAFTQADNAVHATMIAMEDVDLIALAIPFFLISIFVEVVWTRLFGPRDAYRVGDAIANLSAGIGDEVTGVFISAASLVAYIGLYDHFRVATLDESHWATWAFALLAVDFIYFLWHWASHRIHLIWATHVVHHQSEEYNLSVALRQSWTDTFTSWPLYLPLALLGVSPFVLVVCRSVNTLYQFWVHTRVIGRLGPLEWFMVTPSNHRVHHARNPKYIDRNYGGILCLWDRIFGTFAAEEEEPVYGTVSELKSFNPFLAQTQLFAKLARMSRQAPTWREAAWVWVSPPEYQIGGGTADIPEIARDTQVKYDPGTDVPTLVYTSLHFVLPIATVTTMLFLGESVGLEVQLGLALVAWTSLLAAGGLLEGRAWARPLEWVRLAGIVAGLGIAGASMPVLAAAGSIAVVSAVWVARPRTASA
ncbi:MAG: fatty acid hydroxylase family protein [Deltaproteobacteria bacterium]|nr:MAG: fatty acid hydroxylase family protein [Deltaproteobacteria bacterium]